MSLKQWKIRSMIWFTLFLGYGSCFSQDLHFFHFGPENGIPAKDVYEVYQDRQGFIWLATTKGVYRFDGRTFTAITTSDGLLSNEILWIAEDRRGRIWFLPYQGHLAYYHEGKVVLQDPSLVPKNKKEIDSYQVKTTNSEGELIVYSNRYGLVKITEEGGLDSLYGMNGSIYALEAFSDDRYVMASIKCLNLLENGQVEVLDSFPRHLMTVARASRFDETSILYVVADTLFLYDLEKRDYRWPPIVGEFSRNAHFLSHGADGITWVGNADGAWALQLREGQAEVLVHCLEGKGVTSHIQDNEGNHWFTTYENGLYFATTLDAVTYQTTINGKHYPIFSIGEDPEGRLAFGSKHNQIFFLDEGQMVNKRIPTLRNYRGRVRSFANQPNGDWWVITEEGMYEFEKDRVKTYPRGAKKIFFENDTNALIVSTAGLRDFDLIHPPDTTKTTKELYATEFHYLKPARDVKKGPDGVIWFSGNYGLYRLDQDRKPVKVAGFSSRVNEIGFDPSGNLWAGTDGEGVFVFRGDSMITNFKVGDGLTSNNCEKLFVDDRGMVWVTSPNYLCWIVRGAETGSWEIGSYTLADGLPSPLITDVYVKGEEVWVSTMKGVTRLKRPSGHPTQAKPTLWIEGVRHAGMDSLLNSQVEFAASENNITVRYKGLHFKSLNRLKFQYRLLPDQEEWKTTTEEELYFPNLSPGDYTFEVKAIGVQPGDVSSTEQIFFSVDSPYYQKAWFLVLVGIAIAGTVSLLFLYQLRRVRRTNFLRWKIHHVEQQAIQAQMNPHFIFNALNSIRNCIYNGDSEAAIQYLGNFARMVRYTLENSQKGIISLDSEIRYLKAYIDLEALRFKDRFSTRIEVSPELDTAYLYIPAMIIQPFLENAFKHAAPGDGTRQVQVTVEFREEGDQLVCRVEDDGVGFRKEGGAKKTSFALQAIEERINILNELGGEVASLEMLDKGEIGKGSGTIAILHFDSEKLFDSKVNLANA